MGWVKMRHKDKPEVRYWVREGANLAAMAEIRACRQAYYDLEDLPPERCLPGGTFPLEAIHQYYEPVEVKE